ncbi:MAG: pyridoxal phosphate-dependent aminotransferase [Leptospiraceae bacterium]|nr:pyridoxal phosphate-dependent aminotransferase [Leptospiraceae bacterium]MDW7976362.1 pyridoxal phosphate-dependent aminotransferase [Leptospiraceae bacterium]
MRTNIVHIGATELSYEIRGIVSVAEKIKQITGRPIIWENIGDPVQKGEKIPLWMKEIIHQAINKDEVYAYSPTKGLKRTREFLAEKVNKEGYVQIDPEDIIFFNGLGDAVSKIYGFLRKEARVIGPSPAYPTHSSAEAAHAGSPPITYKLDPNNNWMPDLEELYNKVKYNESIAGIMIINPDNPTGAVFPEEVLKEIVRIAKEFDLFILSDEIYINMTYNGTGAIPIAKTIEDVPAISMKGISKELPWPGGRCGWIEIYNHRKNPMFEQYIKSILNAKMLEVSSTTLPQYVIPDILSHPEYPNWLNQRNQFYKKRSEMLQEIFSKVPGIKFNPPKAAFYASIVFEEPITKDMKLEIPDKKVREFVETLCSNPSLSNDQRFVYYLLGAKQICVVPLSTFVTPLQGFRCTLLEQDDDVFIQTYTTIADAIVEYYNSAKTKVFV